MVPSGCELDDQESAEQLSRYRQLGGSVLDVQRHSCTARILFTEHVDTLLLQETLAIERGCCDFFTLDYDPSERVLSIGTDGAHADALSVLLSALTPTRGR